jgi:hypothetical protein
MFAVVFALSLNLVEVLLFEILDVLDPRCCPNSRWTTEQMTGKCATSRSRIEPKNVEPHCIFESVLLSLHIWPQPRAEDVLHLSETYGYRSRWFNWRLDVIGLLLLLLVILPYYHCLRMLTNTCEPQYASGPRPILTVFMKVGYTEDHVVFGDGLLRSELTNLYQPAAKLQSSHAAGASLLFLGIFMYAFWRIGRYWPGVPPPERGILRLEQVRSILTARKACSPTKAHCGCYICS